MGYPQGHKEKTRARVLSAAQKLWKSKGYEGASVDAVMQEAGLTRGGFYAHFKSKEDLFASILGEGKVKEMVNHWPEDLTDMDADARRQLVFDIYLSTAHRDHLADACPLTLFAQQAQRMGEKPRATVSSMLKGFARWLGYGRSTEDGLLALSTMVGAMTLARAVDDKDVSDQILTAARNKLREM